MNVLLSNNNNNDDNEIVINPHKSRPDCALCGCSREKISACGLLPVDDKNNNSNMQQLNCCRVTPPATNRHLVRCKLIKLHMALLISTLFTAVTTVIGKPAPDSTINDNINGLDDSLPRTRLTEAIGPRQPECHLYIDASKNDLSPVNLVVKSEDTSVACIRASFMLAIKVGEAAQFNSQNESLNQPAITLGYLLLDNEPYVEHTCPSQTTNDNEQSRTNDNDRPNNSSSGKAIEESEMTQLEMSLTFECAKLSFTFQRDEHSYFISSIKGLVRLDNKTKREFISYGPMFITSDLDHRFKYDDLIEVKSTAQPLGFELSANFYSTEIEAFRNTDNIGFIRPPDENSKPFPDNK